MTDTSFKIGQKVKILKTSEHSAGLIEIGRGYVIAIASGKLNQWIKFMDNDWEKNFDLAEWVCVNAPCIKVVKA